MMELVSLRYTNPRKEIAKNIDHMAALIEQFLSMQASMETFLQVGILIAYIDVAEMRPVISAINTI